MASQSVLHGVVAPSETGRGSRLTPFAWTHAALVLLLFLTLHLALKAHAATRRPRDYPPGPRCVPFLGNLASIPLCKPYFRFSEWSRQYGPILGLKAGPLNLVVLQDPADIHELFDRRGGLYGGRPYNYIALNHVFDPEIGQILLFQRNDRLLKRWKRTARWFLSPQGVEALGPVIDAVSARCVRALTERPAEYREHLRAWSLSTPLVALTGQAGIDEGLLQTYFYRQTLLTGLLEPGRTPPVDFVVLLRWVPARWAKWKRDARFVREHQDEFYGEMVAKVKAAREKRRGQRHDQTADDERYVGVMERAMDEGMAEKEAKWLAGGLLDAAFDTLSTAVLTFLVAMAAHAHVLAKARDEVDNVCGGKMPRGEDVAKMPYLKACLLEMLRWRPSTPLGLPHVTESDDTYKGYVIPRGTNVVVNAYGLLHDPEVHGDPDRFDPERYFVRGGEGPMKMGPPGTTGGDGKNGNDDDEDKDGDDERRRSTWVFGAGRRRCMGEHFTTRSLMTVMAKAVWALDMSVPAGTDLSVEKGFSGGLVMRAEEHIAVEVGLREGRGEGVREEWKRGEKELKKMLG